MNKLINIEDIHFQRLNTEQYQLLVNYLDGLSDESKSRFGPHAFTLDAIQDLANNDGFCLFVAIHPDSDQIIAYTILKKGWIDYESPRLSSYGLIESINDTTIAPSVADQWQSKGLGTRFFKYVLNELKINGQIERIFLWGGVQNSNVKAIQFYTKLGFKMLGEFEYHGMNTDMVLDI